MGDRSHRICILDPAGEVVSRNTEGNTARALRKCFKNQYQTILIEPGKIYLECSDKKRTITIHDATGVLFEELPGSEAYRGYHYAH